MGWIVLAAAVLLIIGCFVHFKDRFQAYQFDDDASFRNDAESNIAALVIFLFSAAVIWYLLSQQFWTNKAPSIPKRVSPAVETVAPREATPETSPDLRFDIGPAPAPEDTFTGSADDALDSDADWDAGEDAYEPIDDEIATRTATPEQTLIEDSIIYFPLDSTLLVCEARDQLQLVADFADDYDVIAIDLFGHTDTAGESQRNQKLSRERAEKVRRHLVNVLDIDPNLIRTIGWRGETAPVEATGDGVREQRNRRVEIVIEFFGTVSDEAEPIPSVWFERGLTNCPDTLAVPPTGD